MGVRCCLELIGMPKEVYPDCVALHTRPDRGAVLMHTPSLSTDLHPKGALFKSLRASAFKPHMHMQAG